MGRPPLPVGTFGKIDFLILQPSQVRARARYRDYDGVVRTVTRFRSSRPKAEAALKEALRDRVAPTSGELNGDSRTRDLAAQWLKEITGRDLAPATKEMYADMLQRHVIPGLGELRIKELSVPTADRFIKLVSERSGAGTAKTVRSVLSGMLGLAVRHGAITHNPIRDVGRIARPRKQVRALTRAEADELRLAIHRDEIAQRLDLPELIDFLLGTGLRIGEACAVQWSDADLSAGVLDVNATAVRTKDRGLEIQKRPKSAAGSRVIALPRSVVLMLQKRLNAGRSSDDVIFASPLGQLRDRSNTTADLRRTFDRAGYRWVTSHTFRKTVATRLDDAGLSARQIADHLGHARPSLTQDVYLGRKVVTSAAAELLDFCDPEKW
ncbi:MAG: tyrosine-type recombinase/integrase [Jatrophihabitantaceae bacterium]